PRPGRGARRRPRHRGRAGPPRPGPRSLRGDPREGRDPRRRPGRPGDGPGARPARDRDRGGFNRLPASRSHAGPDTAARRKEDNAMFAGANTGRSTVDPEAATIEVLSQLGPGATQAEVPAATARFTNRFGDPARGV